MTFDACLSLMLRQICAADLARCAETQSTSKIFENELYDQLYDRNIAKQSRGVSSTKGYQQATCLLAQRKAGEVGLPARNGCLLFTSAGHWPMRPLQPYARLQLTRKPAIGCQSRFPYEVNTCPTTSSAHPGALCAREALDQ